MEKNIYVVGHKNPDTDSIASAIAYAELKRALGHSNVTAARAGEVNPQTEYILGRLGIEKPLLLVDVYPKVKDIIARPPVIARENMSLRDALNLFHKHTIRILPVVDDNNMPVGIVPLLKLSEKHLVTGTSRKRGVDTSISLLCRCLEGDFISGESSEVLEHLHLFIGAMGEDSFAEQLSGYDNNSLLVVTGDRSSIQKASIELGVRVLIVTGGYPVDAELLEQARCAGVVIISTPYDTATAAWLVRLSTPLSRFVEPGFEKIGLDDPLESLRLRLLHSGEPAVIVVDENGAIAGVATKSLLLASVSYALILVDHNELSQAVPGSDEVEILEVIDHHKLGHPATHHPITFMAAPVGSTCTIVASMYRERGIEPERKIAALLLAGVLSDTVILKSPTTTQRDREVVGWLEAAAGIEHQAFGKDIFSAGSGFSAYPTLEKAVRSDFKNFDSAEIHFGIGQVEVVGFDEFHQLKQQLREVLKHVREDERLDLAALMVTDIAGETTLLLTDGMEALAHVMGYPQVEAGLYELKGFMSRKKQMVPHLLKVLPAMA